MKSSHKIIHFSRISPYNKDGSLRVWSKRGIIKKLGTNQKTARKSFASYGHAKERAVAFIKNLKPFTWVLIAFYAICMLIAFVGSVRSTHASLQAETKDKTKVILKLQQSAREAAELKAQIKLKDEQLKQQKQHSDDLGGQLQAKRDEAAKVVALPPPAPSGYGGFGGVATLTYGNGYTPGQCTWGIASRVNIPGNWGNATNWDYAAAAVGYAIGYSPRVGAIAVSHTDSWAGHVALVVAVNGSSYTVWEENGIYGPFTTDERTANPSEFTSFIYL